MTPRLSALIEYALMVWIVLGVVFAFCALGIAADVHQARLEFATANAEWRRETFRRLDSLLWKADTALEIGSAARLDLGNMLTKLRAQVKQSADESTKAATVQSKAAAVAVTKALDKTSEAIQAVAGDPPPAVKPEEKPITVNVPPPVVVAAPKPAEAPRVEVTPVEEPKRRPLWKRILWPWGR